MILETRSLIFSDEELVVALKALLAAKGEDTQILPKKIQCLMNDQNDVEVHYIYHDRPDPIIFNSREVGACLLNHCIEQGIPLPRGSYKELSTRGEHIALIVRLETGTVGPGIEFDDE